MDCKTTSISEQQRAGFTLVEFLIAASIGTLVLVTTAALWIYSSNSFAAMFNYVDLDKQSQNALDHLSQSLRRAQSLKHFNAQDITVVDFDGVDLKFKYDPHARTLKQTKKGQTTILLTECDQLEFSIFQRNPVANSYDQYPAADAKTCKLVQVQWTCSRQLYGRTAHTDSVRSAKIVLRKV